MTHISLTILNLLLKKGIITVCDSTSPKSRDFKLEVNPYMYKHSLCFMSTDSSVLKGIMSSPPEWPLSSILSHAFKFVVTCHHFKI